MESVTNLLFQLFAIVLALVALLYAVLSSRKEHRKRVELEKKLLVVEKQLKTARQQYDGYAKQFNELRAGSMAMSNRVVQLNNEIDALNERQNEVELNDPDGKLYSRANRLVELGADITEIMEECEIPKAEAELLIRLQRTRESS